MPWKVFREGNKHKVYKVNESGNKIGSPLGTHADPKKAAAQVRALYANEKPKKESPEGAGEAGVTQTYTASTGDSLTVTVTDSVDDTESKEAKMMGGACSWEEMEAMEEAEGMTKAYYKMSDQMGIMAHNIMRNPMIEDKAGALSDLATGYADRVKKVADGEMPHEGMMKELSGEPSPGFINKLKSWLGLTGHQSDSINEDKDKPGGDSDGNTTTETHKDLFIWKEDDTYRWLAAYSNNRRDDDTPPEIISSESHKEFDQALTKGEWPMPELWVWHIPYSVGKTIYHAYDEANGFPIAGGVFHQDKYWVAEALVKASWDGVSHGMPSEWIRRDSSDPTIIIRHRTKEISILPKWAAANKFAFTLIDKEKEMADQEQEKGLPAHKREEMFTTFGERAKEFEEALDKTSKETRAAGVEEKEQEAPEAAQPALTPDNPVVKALAMVVEQLSALETRLKAIEEKQATQAEVKEQPFDLIEFLTSKSAIGKPENKVDGRTALAKSIPEETAQPSWTESAMGVRLGLVDQFVVANQEWQNRTGGTN